jgi:single-strand DNA-binding protein
MRDLPLVTMEGTLVADPELRFSPSGVAVCSFRLAANGRRFDKDKNEWVDDKVLFMRCVCFRQLAENTIESLVKGDLAIVVGKISTEEWEDSTTGEKRSAVELLANSVAVSLQFRTTPHGSERPTRRRAEDGPPQDDRWATPPPSQSEEPPF